MSQESDPRHPIAVVARRTGLSQQLLRAWERRYSLVVPQRTPTGRRLYSDRDLEALALVKQLVDAGYRVGTLQERSLPELRELAAEKLREGSTFARAPGGDADTVALLDQALAATSELDSARLSAVLREASVVLSRPALRSLFLHPLLLEIGHRWQTGELRIAHEHMATALVRSFLADLNKERRSVVGAGRLVAGTLPGQRHELGLLLAVSHVLDQGWDVVYLGADLPVEEFVSAARSGHATAVLLSLVYPAGDPATARAVQDLGDLLPADCTLIVGGQAVGSYAEAIVHAGAVAVADLDELEAALARLAR